MQSFRPRPGRHADRHRIKTAASSRSAQFTRRAVIGALAAGGVFTLARSLSSAQSDPFQIDPGELTYLGDEAARANLIFGASIGDAAFADDAYRRVYLDNARILTSDLALKLLILRPDQGKPRYAEADALVEFAAKNQMLFRGHCLIWNENNPAWVNALGQAELGAFLDRHVDETVGRYAGRIHSWDVVNEPFWPDHRAPGGYRMGAFYNALGPAYIERALRRAAAADRTTKLVINEAFTERGDALGLAVRAGMLRLIDDLQHRGAPLHAIGLEAHLQPQYPADDDGFVRFLEQIAARGLEIYITELDIDDTALPRNIAERDRAAALRVGQFLERALVVPAIKIVECWQLSDLYSWYADPEMLRKRAAGDMPRPLPFDADQKPKLMQQAIVKAFRSRPRAG
jgi:endo-1,4-beta-xylanase